MAVFTQASLRCPTKNEGTGSLLAPGGAEQMGPNGNQQWKLTRGAVNSGLQTVVRFFLQTVKFPTPFLPLFPHLQ